MELKGKVAIVTGSGGEGCGRGIALRLAREGCAVVVSDINEAGAARALEMIEAGRGTAAVHNADVSSEAQVHALVDFAVERFGGLDILVNNASRLTGPGTRLTIYSPRSMSTCSAQCTRRKPPFARSGSDAEARS